MKKRSIKLLLTGIVICTSISTIGCHSSDFEEPVEEEVTEEQQVKSEVERKEPKNEQKEKEESTKQSEKSPVKQPQENLIAWAKSNVNSKAVVKITEYYQYPDCSGDVYVDDMYIGSVYYSYRNDVYELEKPYDRYGPDSYVPDMPSYDGYYDCDESDEYDFELNEYCMNCGKAFVGSQSGYCNDCASKILGDNYDFLQ